MRKLIILAAAALPLVSFNVSAAGCLYGHSSPVFSADNNMTEEENVNASQVDPKLLALLKKKAEEQIELNVPLIHN